MDGTEFKRDRGTFQFTAGTAVTVKIVDPAATPPPTPAPGAPAGLRNTVAWDTTLSFMWHFAGTNVFQYRYRASGGTWPSSWTNRPNINTAHLYDLTQGTSYDFEVRRCGASDYTNCGTASAITASTTGTVPPPVTAPDAPRHLQASAFNNEGALMWLNWTDDDQPWFQWRHREHTDPESEYGAWSARQQANRELVTGLSAGTTYDFQVRACAATPNHDTCNADADAAHVRATTWELVVPAPPVPTGLRITREWPRSISFAWHRTYHQSGGRYWQYQVCQGQNCSNWSAWAGWGNTGKRYIADMWVSAEPGKHYRIRIRACNEERGVSTCGDPTDPVDATTPSGAAVGNVRGQAAGSGRVKVSWQAPDGGGSGGEEASGASLQSASATGASSLPVFDARSASAAGVRTTEDDPPEDDPSDAPEAADPSYEVAWTPDGSEWSEGGSRQIAVTDASATVEGLTNGQRYALRVRVVQGEWQGEWSDTVYANPAPLPATLVQPFADLSLANGAARGLDMGEHFSGDGLTYAVMVTTTHKGTGEVKTAPINTVARNKVRGAWSDDVLTLTAGPSGRHVLALAITATDGEGGTASDSFELTVDGTGAPGRPATGRLR